MGLRETPTLKEILEAATPGRWMVDPPGTKMVSFPSGFDRPEHIRSMPTKADAALIALAPELASLVLDMGDVLMGILHDLDNGDDPGRGQKEMARNLLARLDQLGAADKTQHGKEHDA